MDEEKAAAYYEELTRKGGGAAKFKQGLGFSSTSAHNDSDHSDGPPKLGSALASSSSFLSTFVKASGNIAAANTSSTSELDKRLQLQSIQNKLKKKDNSPPPSRVSERSHRESRTSPSPGRDRDFKRRSRSRERYSDRDRERHSSRRSSSRETHRGRDRNRSRERGRRRSSRSRSRSGSDRDRRQRDRKRCRSRSSSPRNRRKSERSAREKGSKGGKSGKVQNAAIDYERLIDGYDKMTPADRVKAKMKLQLSETAEKDSDMGPGWERFRFDKDAPVEDEEFEAAEDDSTVMKHIGQSFRFSAVEARREKDVKAAHDEAMFGVPELPPSIGTDSEPEEKPEASNTEIDNKNLAASLLNESVLAMRKGSWRDRVRNA